MRLITLQDFRRIDGDGIQFHSNNDKILRINVLNHDLIRISFYPDGQPRLNRTWMVIGENDNTPREGRLRDDPSPFPCPAVKQTNKLETVTIETAALRFVIHLKSAHIDWFDTDGRMFAGDLRNRAYTYDRNGRSIYHYLQRRTDEYYFGFGERSGPLDKQGRRFRMLNVDALGYNAETSDPLYKHFPFYITFIPELNIAYGLFYDNVSTTVFDLGHEIDAFWGYYRYWMAEDGDLDYYVIYGPTIAEVVEKFTALTGKPALLPRWSLGYLGSTMSYTEAPDAQNKLKRFVELCEQHEIPCDMFHLSSGYTTDETGRRFVFTWNRKKVPSPVEMVQSFHDAGIRLAPNIKPYLLVSHPQYEIVRAASGFISNPDTGEPSLSRFWSGGAFESEEGSYIDFTSAAGFNWWKEQAKLALLSLGIDALWNDNNEFEIWDDEALCEGNGNPIRIAMARPLQTLLMARASYEAVLAQKPNERPFILSRSATTGMQRYVQTWSGDNETSWHSLKFNIPMGLGMGLSGMPNIGHDIGGFFGPAPNAELFVRWVQNGIFHPRFTIHSWNTDGTVNEPWMHPDVLTIVRSAIQFRYRLMPYLYSLMFESHQTGAPIIRPLVYHFPNDARCHTESFDFLLGSHLLVATVLEAGARKRKVYLPYGTWWCDYYSGQWHEGGQEIEVDAPLDRIPLFVADGGVIPMGPIMRYVGEQPDNDREILVYARSEANFSLIEDDGISLDYQQGGYSTLHLNISSENQKLVASAKVVHNGYSLPYKTVKFIVATLDRMELWDGISEDGRWRVTVPVTQ